MKRVKYVMLIIYLCFFINTNAQIIELFEKKTYSKGYIITVNKDTINGFIIDADMYGGTIKYKINQEDKDVQKIDDSEVEQMKVLFDFYDKVICDNKSYLMKRIVKGEISFYQYAYTKKYASAPSGMPGEMSTGANFGQSAGTYEKEDYYLVKGGLAVKIKKRKLHELLKEFMIDCQVLYPEIDKLDTDFTMLNYNLKNLVSKYNYTIKKK